MSLEIGHLEIFVSDPMKSKDFYINILGFKEVVTQNDTFVWLKLSSIEILLRPHINKKTPSSGCDSPALIVFYTDNLVQTKLELTNMGVQFLDNDNSETCPIFTDLDGNKFQLVDPLNH